MSKNFKLACLEKVLKSGHRRSRYRRWEITLTGKSITIRTTNLERMYRGITPSPTSSTKISRKVFSNLDNATKVFKKLIRRKKFAGYS